MVNTIEELKDLLLSIYFPEINKKLFYTQKHGENSIIVLNCQFPEKEKVFTESKDPKIIFLREKYKNLRILLACVNDGFLEIPTCPICGKFRALNHSGRHFMDTCGDKSCAFDLMVKTNKDNHNGVFSTSDPQCIEKTRKTSREKFGTDWPTRSQEVKQKTANTNLERHGTTVGANSPEIHQKIIENNIIKYGVESYSQTQEFKEKLVKTSLERYGVEYPSQTPEFKEKVKQTNLERYGETSYAKTSSFKEFMSNKHKETREKGHRATPRSRYVYNNVYFDSSWELAFYIYHKDNNLNIERNTQIFKYWANEKEHDYTPDFKVNEKFIEIKGDFLWEFDENNNSFFKGKDLEKEKQRQKCAIDNNVMILYEKDMKKYLDYCKKKFNNKLWYHDFLKNKEIKKEETNESS